MLRKCINKFFGLCVVTGLVLLMGTVGASDCNLITDGQLIVRSIISLMLIGIGAMGSRFAEYYTV